MSIHLSCKEIAAAAIPMLDVKQEAEGASNYFLCPRTLKQNDTEGHLILCQQKLKRFLYVSQEDRFKPDNAKPEAEPEERRSCLGFLSSFIKSEDPNRIKDCKKETLSTE